MAVVTGALLSLNATGKIGNTLEFSCGQRVGVPKRKNPGEGNDVFNEQQEKFKSGIGVWKTFDWEDRQKWNRTELILEGGTEVHPQTIFITGYQAFMSYYLRYGVGGWTNYPLPP